MTAFSRFDLGVDDGPPQLLWEDGERRFSRVWREGADGARQDCIAVEPVREQRSQAEAARLAHEFALRDELDAAWALRPLALVRDRGVPMLVLEDQRGRPVDRVFTGPLAIERFLRLGAVLADSLGRMHGAGLVHKDIKPANILVDAANERVWLTGFGVATRLPRERQAPEAPEFIAGTLSHMAPEQTGRMNRSIDSRSDLYSLGVTLYKLLTGVLPFTATDPMEWVHCHLARRPEPPGARVAGVPPQVGSIVMKLLAKTPEDRYQTAAGVAHDLRRCLAALEAGNEVGAFALGESDRSDRLIIPERLYGRATEIDVLISAFDQVVEEGRPRLVLVRGRPGVGKSSVVNELHKVLVPPRGLFASGKFDQQRRDVPYATVAQAMSSLVRTILLKPEDELAAWRDEIRLALESNGAHVIDLIPELKHVIGDQPAVPELPPPAAKARFQRALRRFIGVFARPEHPLALFLDDLQWLDAATLELLEDLIVQPDVGSLLLVGAYRDNEVDAAHPLTRRLEAMRDTDVDVREIALAPLRDGDLARLLEDALHCAPRRAMSLAQLVHAKTGGNPFFASQFLHALVDDGAVAFDRASAEWRWELGQIEAKGHTENVVELMVGKLGRWPQATRQALMELACLGHQAKASMLAIVHGSSLEQLESDLWEALRAELVVSVDDTIRFAHDRVQEAAYALVPQAERAREHLRIGRALLARLAEDERDKALFDIVGQFNRGAALIDTPEEREQVAELDLAAGKRARAAVAYASAFNYITAGVGLLAPDSWERRHALAFELERSLAEGEFLAGNVVAAQQRLERLSSRAADAVERCAAAALRADVLFALQRPDLALAVCLECLRLCGLNVPEHPTPTQMRQAYEATWTNLAGREIEELLELPLMSDPASKAELEVLFRASLSATTVDRDLACVLVCAAVDLSMEQGNADGSCVAYASFGWMSGWQFGRVEGYGFGRLGYELMERKGLRRMEATVRLIFTSEIVPWTQHVGYARELIRGAFDAAMKAGDRFSAVACHGVLVSHLLMAGESLGEVAKEAGVGLEIARNAQASDFVTIMAAQAGLVRTLRGLSRQFGALDGEDFSEDAVELHYATQPHLPTLECWYLVRKLQARYFAGDHAAALAVGKRTQLLLWSTPAFLEVAECEFYTALAHTALCESISDDEGRQHLLAAIALQRRLEAWARDCPENFENRAVLVAAEIARLEGRDPDAMRLYDRALQSAADNGFVHNEALANELAARFYASRGFDKIARAYLQDARAGYLSWGADGKVRQLDERDPRLLEREIHGPLGGTVLAPVAQLDLATLTKVLQAVSSEIELDRLVAMIMRLALEHAGAERGLLILPHDGGHRIEAEARTERGAVTVDPRPAAITGEALPLAALQYVLRTGESVLLRDASTDPSFSGDGHVRASGARSVLCMPLHKQMRLVGILYLENNLAPGVFTPARMALLRLLASEAAISLENARLYRDLQEREARVRRLVDANIIGIAIWHADGRILDINDAFLGLLGYEREDFASGRVRWTDFVPPEWREHDARALVEIRASGTAQAHERDFLRKDGTRVPVLAGGATFDATPDEGVAFVVDLTEQKRAEEVARDSEFRFHQMQMQLTDANRVASVGQLAASIAHEINQPLAGITTNAGTCLLLLASKSVDLDSLDTLVRRTLRDVNRASDIVTRLRAMFANKEMATATVDLNEALREAIALASTGLQRSQVILRCEFAQDLPPITGDVVQLQQVISNLLRNASDAMGRVDDRPRQLVVRTVLEGADLVRLDVEDSGTGLDTALLDKLFKPFYTTKPDGMGVGLSVSRSIIERHNGRLWATPNEGPGATFSFSLPRAGPAAPSARP